MRGMFKRLGLSVLLGSLALIGGASTSLAQPPTQASGPARAIRHDQTGFFTFIGVDAATPDAALPGAQAFQAGRPTAATAMADIAVYAREFGLDNPGQQLRLTQSAAVPGGSAAFRYQQVHQGIPVIAGEMLANYNARGRLSALAGETSPQLALSTTPKVTADVALTLALQYVAQDSGLPAMELTGSAPALWIYDPRLLQPTTLPARLVWRTEITPVRGHMPIRYLVLVDAQLLNVALAFNQVDTFWGDHAAAYATNVIARPEVSTVNLPAFAPNFISPLGVTYNSNLTPTRQVNTVCNTPPAALTGAGSCDGSASATAANMAHYFAYNTFHYYDSQHNRNSIDGNGMALISNVNYRENPSVAFANAFWDGVQMTYGDADTFTVDDVVAHELSHGVTEQSSGLFYFYESGAINESMSDVFGEFADQWNGINSFGGADAPADQWLLGEDMTAGSIRNMANPPLLGNPDSTQSPYYTTDPFLYDGGGVHTNSGVSNKAAYLMAAGGTFGGYTITPLGNAKTAAIYYEANTTLLTSGADYQMLGAALVQACNNIRAGANPLGITATECEEVNEAARAVGMHLDPVAGVEFAPQADLCPAGYTVQTHLFKDDFESGTGNFTSGITVNPGGSVPPNWSFVPANQGFGSSYATSGTESLFGVNHPILYRDSTATEAPYVGYAEFKNGVSLPSASTYYLSFNHVVALETWVGISTIRDGAFVEYSVNGGAWQNAGPLFSGGKNYDGPIAAEYGNPRAGQPAFGNQSHGYVSSRYDLTSLAGKSVKFRWVIAADSERNYWGWFIDDVQIYKCAPAREVTLQGQEATGIQSGGTYNLGLTFVDQPTTRTMTVTNTGIETLTLATAAPSVTTGFVVSNYGSTVLAPGASTTFDLTCLATAGGSPITGTVSISSDGIVDPFTFRAACIVLASGTTAYATRNYYTMPDVTLSWSPVTWAADYEIQVSQSRYFTGAAVLPVDPPDILSKNLSLTIEGLYYWRVRAIRANGTRGAWSAADTFFLNLP